MAAPAIPPRADASARLVGLPLVLASVALAIACGSSTPPIARSNVRD
jgi:hypothetical protein